MAKDLTAALHALTEQANGQDSRQDASLPAPLAVPSIPARKGSGTPKTSTSSSGSGGVGYVSPLVETAYTDRTWHAARTVTSSDGIFSFRVRDLASIKFEDSAVPTKATLTMQYKAGT